MQVSAKVFIHLGTGSMKLLHQSDYFKMPFTNKNVTIYSIGAADTPSKVIFTGLIVPSGLNSILSIQVTR